MLLELLYPYAIATLCHTNTCRWVLTWWRPLSIGRKLILFYRRFFIFFSAGVYGRTFSNFAAGCHHCSNRKGPSIYAL